MPRAPFFSFFRRNVTRHPSVPVIKSRFPVISAPPPSAFYLLYARAPVSPLPRFQCSFQCDCVTHLWKRGTRYTLYIRALFLISGNTLGEDGARC